jgi:hypothetical protein
MVLYDIVTWLNLTATDDTKVVLQLEPAAIGVITDKYVRGEIPKRLGYSHYPDYHHEAKPNLQDLIKVHHYLTTGTESKPLFIEFSTNIHEPHMPQNTLVIAMVQIGLFKAYRLSIPIVTLHDQRDDPVFETNLYAILNKEFGGTLHESLLVKPKGL